MPPPRATSQKSALTQAQQTALDGLISMKVPKREAAALIDRAHGSTDSEILFNALRLRGGVSQQPSTVQVQGAMPPTAMPSPVEPRGAILPAPQAQPSQPQQQIPGFGPPGGPQAAPNAQQLQASVPPPGQGGYNPNWFWRAMGAAPPPAGQRPPLTPTAEQGYNPNAFWRAMGAPRPAPVGQGPLPTQGPTASPQMTPSGPPPAPIGQQRRPMQAAGPMPQPAPIAQRPSPASLGLPGAQMMPSGSQSPSATPQPMPPPLKPRVRVRAVGRQIPEAPAEASKPQELPLIETQEHYNRLPIGARFKHPDGYIYRKESHSHEVPETPQKMATGGEVQPDQEQVGQEPPQPPQPPQPGNTDTVPAMLTPGEYVMSKPAVDQLGAQHMQELEQLLATERAQSQSPNQAPAQPLNPSQSSTGKGVSTGSAPSGGGSENVPQGHIGDRHLGAFGYIGDATPDHASLMGEGAYTKGKKMIEGYSTGLSYEAQKKYGIKPGQEFSVGGHTFRLDDTNTDPGQEDYVDVYYPSHAPDKGHENDADAKINGHPQSYWFAQRGGVTGSPSEEVASSSSSSTQKMKRGGLVKS
jgi:hypothetical protein